MLAVDTGWAFARLRLGDMMFWFDFNVCRIYAKTGVYYVVWGFCLLI